MSQQGGEDVLLNIIRALLEMKSILFLPNSDIVEDKTRYSDYFSSIDSKTLLYLIKEYNIPESETVKLLFGGPENPNAPQIPDASSQILENINTIKPTLENTSDYTYYKQFLELNTQLQQLYSQIQKLKANMEMYNRQLSQFQCIKGLDNLEHGFISNFILDCSKYSIKNVDWFRVILKIDKLDDEYEIAVNRMYNERGINLRYDLLKPFLDRLETNTKLKSTFEDRLIGCGKDPFSFWGNIDFSSLNDCDKCHDDCIVYLNKNYKAFLMEPDPNIDVTTKLKILVYCEYRLFQLSKHITLEAIRLQKQRYTKVLNILKNLSKKDKNRVFMKQKIDERQKQDSDKMKELKKEQQKLSENIKELVDKRGFSGGNPLPQQEEQPQQQQQQQQQEKPQQQQQQQEQPQQQQQEHPVEQKILNESGNFVYEDLVPDCDAITSDILNGKIKRENFLYLSPHCNTEIMNALTNS